MPDFGEDGEVGAIIKVVPDGEFPETNSLAL
jgi:hypothetical protein